MTLPRNVTVFTGRKGKSGSNGIDGLGSQNIRAGLIANPICSLFSKNQPVKLLQGPLSYTDNSGATFNDMYGNTKTVAALTNTNLFTYSEDLTQWTLTELTILSSTEPDPFGTSIATKISADTAGLKGLQLNTTLSKNNYYSLSFYIKSDGVIDGISVFGDSGYSRNFNAVVTSNYTRVTGYFTGEDLTFLGLKIDCAAGVEFTIAGLMLQEDVITTQYIKTNGQQESVTTVGNTLRQSRGGYLLEQETTNLLTETEDLINDWTVTGGTTSSYDGLDPFGQKGKKINLKSFGSDIADLTNTASAPYFSGQNYTVSFYAQVLGGSVAALLVSVAGGAFVPAQTILTTSIQRYSLTVIAGDENSDLVFRLSSAAANADIIITGLQCELGDRMTSYIRSAGTPKTRSADVINIGYKNNIPNLLTGFTFLCTIKGYDPKDGQLYVLDNGKAGTDQFACWIDNSNLYIRNSVETLFFEWTAANEDLAISASSGGFSVYADGSLVSAKQLVGAVVSSADTMHLFSDNAGNNNINSHVSNVLFFNHRLNNDEISYLQGGAL